jgi:hypothetical protein
MNSSKIFLTILLIIIVCVCSCNQPQQTKEESINQKQTKEESINQKLEFRGIRLGMSFEELKSKYPKFTDITDSSGVYGQLGRTAIKLDLKDVPELKGLEGVSVTFLDEKVYIAGFKYYEKFSKFNPVELTKQFEESLGLKNMHCEPWKIEDKGLSYVGYVNYAIKTVCKPYSITISEWEGLSRLTLEDEVQATVLEQRDSEIKKMREMNKPKPMPQKTFQP